MRAVVFAGPSLGPAPAPPEGVTLEAPAVAGDLYRAARAGARVIGLVDGAFEDRATVWHKEILYALGLGVRVIGAASLGALRAVECAPFGMEGVGEIFARFASGALEDDAELALSFGPREMGYPALSTPLVNIRATLERAEALGVIEPAAGAALLGLARSLFFKDLTWPRLLAEARAHGIAPLDRLSGWLPGGAVDLKRADALALIEAVSAALAAPAPPPAPFRFAESRVWRRAAARFEERARGLSAREAGVLDEMRLDPVRFERALTRAYARRAARSGGAEPETSEAALIEALRLQLDLPTAGAFRDWLAALDATPRALARALADEERLRAVLEEEAAALAPSLLDEARIEGGYDAFAARAEAKAAVLADTPSPHYDEAELEALLRAFCARRRVSLGVEEPDLLARALGLADRRALHRLLRAEEDFLAAGRRERRA